MKKKTKENKLSKKQEYIIYSVVLFLFLTLSIIISLKHEYWADEANAWLIAGDSSILDLFTKFLHTDGHPALFHLIIKTFQFFGLSYNNFRIIALIFSTLGVAFFLFKSNYKWYIKVLLPFTYYIFYQYTVITRGYCLVLLLLGLIAYLWEKKKEKCVLFTTLVILLLSLEAYTFFIAGSIYLIYIIEYIKDYLKTKKHNKKLLICLITIFFAFLLTTLYVMPRSDNTFVTPLIMYFISNSFVTTFHSPFVLKIVLTILMVFIIMYLIQIQKDKLLEAGILILPLLLFMMFGYSNYWHNGLFFVLLLFIGWIHNYHKIKFFNIFIVIVCLIQIPWSISSSIYEYKESYSPAEEVADFIKQYDYKNMKIYGLEFYESAINAYFDENIFYNWNKDLRFFWWSKKSDFYNYNINPKTMINENVDMIIVTPTYMEYDRDTLIEHYDEYIFRGCTYFQTARYELMDTYVYVKKDNQLD